VPVQEQEHLEHQHFHHQHQQHHHERRNVPLRAGKSKEDVSFNIKELIHTGEKKGHIGTGPPKSGKALQKQAVAIALKKAGKSKNQ